MFNLTFYEKEASFMDSNTVNCVEFMPVDNENGDDLEKAPHGICSKKSKAVVPGLVTNFMETLF